jgi:hypothetical protein
MRRSCVNCGGPLTPCAALEQSLKARGIKLTYADKG